MKSIKLLIALLFVSSVAFCQGRFMQTSNYIVLKNATIIDAVSDEGKVGSILIKDDKIETVDYSNQMEVPEGAISYDLKGKYIIPGIIDGHVHITHGTEQEAKDHLEIVLKHGVTAVREMGGDGRMCATLKRNMLIGENTGADVFYSTIIAGPKFFERDKRPQSVAKGDVAGHVSWQRQITDSTNYPQIVSEVKGIGATAIKIYACVPPHLIKKVSDEAKKQGLKVWSHAAMAPSKPMDVILGGSECISHAGDFLQYELVDELKDKSDFKNRKEAAEYRKNLNANDWNAKTPKVKKVLKEMKKRNVILDATLYVYDTGLIRHKRGNKVDSTRYKIAMKATKIAYDAGVKINAGSDHMIDDGAYYPKVNIHRELELLEEAGMSKIDVIKAATIINAEVMGQEKNMGTIEEGKLANLVILNSNPLDKISNTRDIKHVFKRGLLIQ